MKKTALIFALILVICFAACSAEAKDREINRINTDKVSRIKNAIAACEKNGNTVQESVLSSDGLVALLAEAEDAESEYLQLYVYGRDVEDRFVPFSEPQVKQGEVTAAEDGGFTVTCDSGTYFVGKDDGWYVSRGGTKD